LVKPERPKTRALTPAETEILSNRLKDLQARPLRAPSPRTTAWKTTDASVAGGSTEAGLQQANANLQKELSRVKALAKESENYRFRAEAAEEQVASLKQQLVNLAEKTREQQEQMERLRARKKEDHPVIKRIEQFGLNNKKLAELSELWVGFVYGRVSRAIENTNMQYQDVFKKYAPKGHLTEPQFKQLVRFFEPKISADCLTRLWFFADSDASGRLDVIEFLRFFSVDVNNEMSDEYYEVLMMRFWRALQARGGLGKVYMEVDKDRDGSWSAEEFISFMNHLKMGLMRREMQQVFFRLASAKMQKAAAMGMPMSEDEVSVKLEELEQALEATACRALLAEEWVRDTFKQVVQVIQTRGQTIAAAVTGREGELEKEKTVSRGEFKAMVSRFVPNIRDDYLKNMWYYVDKKKTGHVTVSHLVESIMSPTLGAPETGRSEERSSSMNAQFALPNQILERVSTLILQRYGDFQTAFDGLDPSLSYHEFAESSASLGLADVVSPQHLFALLDVDRNGRVNRTDWLSVLGNRDDATVLDPLNKMQHSGRKCEDCEKHKNRIIALSNRVLVFEDEIQKRRKTPKDVTVDADALATAKSAHAKLKRQMQSLLTQLALKNETKEEEQRRETTLESESQVHMPLTENALKLRAVQEGRLLNISHVVSQLVCAEKIIREKCYDPPAPDAQEASFLKTLHTKAGKGTTGKELTAMNTLTMNRLDDDDLDLDQMEDDQPTPQPTGESLADDESKRSIKTRGTIAFDVPAGRSSESGRSKDAKMGRGSGRMSTFGKGNNVRASVVASRKSRVSISPGWKRQSVSGSGNEDASSVSGSEPQDDYDAEGLDERE
jgi:Ca2+-binding EF-hand superfamily protein